MYDLLFTGGAVGMYVGNQQFTTRNLKFVNVNTAIQVSPIPSNRVSWNTNTPR